MDITQKYNQSDGTSAARANEAGTEATKLVMLGKQLLRTHECAADLSYRLMQLTDRVLGPRSETETDGVDEGGVAVSNCEFDNLLIANNLIASDITAMEKTLQRLEYL